MIPISPDRPIGSNTEESISRPIQVYSTRVNKTRLNSTKHPQFVLPLYTFKCTIVISWQIQVQVNVGSISLPLPHRWAKIWELLSWLKSQGGHNNMRRFSCLNGCLQTHTFEHSVKQTSRLLTIFTFLFVFSPWVGVIQSSEDSKEIHLIPQCQWVFDKPT